MQKIKQIVSGVSLLIATMAFAQNTFTSSRLLPQMYDASSSAPPATSTSVADKAPVLTAKELVDININSMSTDPVLKNAKWAFVIYDPATKKIISSYNENTPLIPASTTKLLTTDAAINMLGEDFKWNTQLEYSGEISPEGVLSGNLYIVGSGDPSLGTGKAGAFTYREIVTQYMAALSDKGIKKVTGNIIIQTGVFKNTPTKQLPANIVWLENNNYYLPVGSTTNIDPASEKLIVKKSSPLANNRKFFYISPYINQTVYAEKFEGLALTTKVADAPYTLANMLRISLIKSGTPVAGKVEAKLTDIEPEKRYLVSTYTSPSLGEIIYDTNQRSDNALAEATLRMLGFQKFGDQTLESGRKVVLEHLQTANFDLEGFKFEDGSGLSRANNVTAIAQAKFLTTLLTKKYFRTYFNSLPIGGQSGTLKKMFLGNGNGQVFAKTGTLSGVKTLAGYLKTNAGKTLVFSVLVNNYSGSVDMVKKRIEKLLEPALNL